MLVAFAVYGLLGHAASIPRFFLDELNYMDIGVSLAQGEGFEFRGEARRYGPVFPLLIAGIVRLTDTQIATYEIVKLVNTAAFVLATIPLYLLSRRLLPPWPSVGAAALCLAIPSSMYVSVVMTESVGYFLAAWAFVAVVRVYEHPGAGRQLAALGVIGLAIATRPQFVAVYAAYLLGLLALAVLSPVHRARLRRLRALWPTVASVVLGLAWFARPLVRGEGIGGALGTYAVLARSYDPVDVSKWFAYHAGDLVLYTAVIPVVVAPVVAVALWRRGRAGSARDAGFLALFATQSLAGVALVAAFASSEFGLGLLYDRYLFYLVPPLLVLFVAWIHDGLQRPVVPLAVGSGLAVGLVAVMPYATMEENSWFRQFQAVATEIWGKVAIVVDRVPVLSLRSAAVLTAIALVAVAVLVPRRLAFVAVGCVALGLAANLSLSWRSNFVPASTYGLSDGASRTWVDDEVGDERVVLLTGGSQCGSEVVYFALLETEVFNRSVASRASVGTDTALRRDGVAIDHVERPLVARYVVTEPDITLEGEAVARGLDPQLVLWRTNGMIRVVGGQSGGEPPDCENADP